MERKIGEIFTTPDGVELEVVSDPGVCRGCYFGKLLECADVNNIGGYCALGFRSDNESIIFKKVENWTPQFGEEVWVSNVNVENAIEYQKSRIFLGEIRQAERPFCCVNGGEENDFTNGKSVDFAGWKCIAKIEEPQIVEITFEDISKGKGVGVDPKLIRIKE